MKKDLLLKIVSSKTFCEKVNKTNENTNHESTGNKNSEDFISFGFKTVKKEERQEMVNSVFANVAKR